MTKLQFNPFLTKYEYNWKLRNLSGVALGYELDEGFESQQWLGSFLLTTMSKPALGPTQHPTQ
jgi:hypothetical protein